MELIQVKHTLKSCKEGSSFRFPPSVTSFKSGINISRLARAMNMFIINICYE